MLSAKSQDPVVGIHDCLKGSVESLVCAVKGVGEAGMEIVQLGADLWQAASELRKGQRANILAVQLIWEDSKVRSSRGSMRVGLKKVDKGSHRSERILIS